MGGRCPRLVLAHLYSLSCEELLVLLAQRLLSYNKQPVGEISRNPAALQSYLSQDLVSLSWGPSVLLAALLFVLSDGAVLWSADFIHV